MLIGICGSKFLDRNRPMNKFGLTNLIRYLRWQGDRGSVPS